MVFSKEFLENRFFQQQMLTVDDWAQNYPSDIGIRYDEDGTTRFCLHAPKAEQVEVELATNTVLKKRVEMKKGEDGCFRGTLAYDEGFTGPANAMVFYDGVYAIEQFFPIFWTGNKPFNIVELPDPEDAYLLIRDVPHGAVSRELFRSTAMGRTERCMVYTPAGYMNGTEAYPVLYLLNGGTDNETSWDNVGKLSNIYDNLIADGEAVPCIVVCANSMLRNGGKVDIARDTAFKDMLLNDLIPYIERHYRVKTGKWNRAIGGLSMGAYMTNDIALEHPDRFGYVGTFTASMAQTPGQKVEQYSHYDRPYPAYLERTDAEQFDADFRVFFRSTTPQEDHLELYEEDDALYRRAGLDRAKCYERILYPPRTSKWNSWRMGLRDYAKRIFQA